MTASAPEARPLHAGEKNRHPDGKSRHFDEKKVPGCQKKVSLPRNPPRAPGGRTGRPALFGEQRALHVQNNP